MEQKLCKKLYERITTTCYDANEYDIVNNGDDIVITPKNASKTVFKVFLDDLNKILMRKHGGKHVLYYVYAKCVDGIPTPCIVIH